MSKCEHEATPCRGYGATTGQHFCRRCGAKIFWDGIQYTEVQEPRPADGWLVNLIWCCTLAGLLVLVSALRHW